MAERRIFPKDGEKRIIFWLFLAVVVLYAVNPLKDSDSFYHLKTGKLILATHSIPQTDVFSYLAEGRPWIAHEWLAEILFYIPYRVAGFWGLMFFVAALAALTYGILFKLYEREGGNVWFGAPLFFILVYLTFQLWIPRPQVFSFAALALLPYLLENFRRRKSGVTPLAFAVALIWVWANLHGSFLLGLAVFGWYAVNEWWENRDQRKTKLLAGGALLAAILAFLNPNGISAYTYLATIQGAVDAFHVAEWSPLLANLDIFWVRVYLALMLAGDVAIFWWYLKKQEILKPGLALAGTALALISIRHIGYWSVLAVWPLALVLSSFFSRVKNKIPERKLFSGALIFLLVFTGLRFLTFPRNYYDPERVPVLAANFIEEQGIKGRIFNLYNEGGYLLWRFWPKEQVAMDGRSEVYGPEEINTYLNIASGAEGWDALADKYGVNIFFLAYQPESLARSVYPLILELMKKNWVFVWWDDAALVFVRNSPENAELIRNYGLRHVSPFRLPYEIGPEEKKAALGELRHLLFLSPESVYVQAYAQAVLQIPGEE